MQTFLEYKWYVLVGLEVLAWASTFFMFYARYGLRSNKLFKLGVFLTVITGVIPQVVIGIINFFATRELDLFTLIIVVLIIYGATIGKKHVKALDNWVQKKFERKQSQKS
ncbi:hypothetical protein [Scopulibacillus cellulosilyticus]|uniref:Uncharacterized protein n=1 Tax=Scopulibacillus cellulosilyticus TaxID=2665665 RepID=A0ABW2PRE1_9BACL